MRLILVLRGYHPSTNPNEIGEFKWSAKHKEYVWQGRELLAAEFNQIVNDVLDRNKDLWAHPVTVKVLHNNNFEKARATLKAMQPKISNPK